MENTEKIAYCVLHFLKYKQELGGIGAHIDRVHVAANVNPDKIGLNENLIADPSLKLVDIVGPSIDRSRTHLNEDYIANQEQSLEKAVWKRIREGHQDDKNKQIRKDAVLAVGVIFSGSPERMWQLQSDEKQFAAWKKATYDFACKMFTKENIVRFTLHMDEKTPHIHCVFVPINPRRRLSARDYLNGRELLMKYQDAYAQVMAPFGLARGIPKTLTHRAHVTTPEYYKDINASTQGTRQLIASIKPENVDQIRPQIEENMVRLQVDYQDKSYKLRYAQTANRNLMEGDQRQVYQQTLREDSPRAHEYIKQEISLIDFAINKLGWQKDKLKSSKQHVALKHPSQRSIVVSTRSKERTGHWVYWSVDGGGGTLIDLLRAEGRSWEDIRSLADEYGFNQSLIQPAQSLVPASRVISAPHSSDGMDPIQASKQAQAHLDRIVRATYQPYLSQRSIKKETYQELQGLKVSDKAAAFPLYKDINESGVGQLCSTITYYTDRLGDRVKYFQKGLARGLSILSPVSCLQEADRFVITESPIDALSYRQLERTGGEEWRVVVGAKQASVSYDQQATVYLSTCGNITNQIRKDLKTVCKLAYEQGKTVVLAMDKDKAGSEMAQSLVHMLKEVGTNYHIEAPTLGKDWNDTLTQAPLLPETVKEAAMRQAEITKACELLERKTYQDSVLPQLGIEQETLAGFKDQVKATERSVVMTLHPIGVDPKIQPTQAAVINNQEVGAEKPAQAVVGSWSLSVDQQGSIQLPVSEGLPPLATLRGELVQASQVVLVCSPFDALLHYQASQQRHRAEAAPRPPVEVAASRQLLDSTCYVYVGRKGYDSPHPFEVVTGMFKNNKTRLLLAIRGDQDSRFNSLEARLQQQGVCYSKELIDTNALVYKKLNLLARSLGLLQGGLGARAIGEDEADEDPEEEQQRKKIRKKQGYRPRL
jgi:hypothetical protein